MSYFMLVGEELAMAWDLNGAGRMTRRFAPLCLALLVVPVVAEAQLKISTTTDLTSTSYTFTSTGCSDTLSLQWNYTVGLLLGTPNGNLKLWSTDGTCGDLPASTDVRYEDVLLTNVLTLKSGTFAVSISALPGFNGAQVDGGTAPVVCGTPGLTKTHQVCGSMTYQQSIYATTTSYLDATPLNLVYDAKPPDAPVITSASGADGTIKIAFTATTDATLVKAELATLGVDAGVTDAGAAEPVFVSVGEALGSANVITVKGLLNGVTYLVRLRASDLAGNVSDPSDVVSVTPIPTCGFWCVLHDAGVTETGGGCDAAPGPAPAAGQPWSLALSALLPLAALGLSRALARKKNPS
jgi:hypothetical protein